MALQLAGESGGPPRPALPPRSQTWAAPDPFAEPERPASLLPPVAAPLSAFAPAGGDDDGSPLGPDAWGLEDSPGAVPGGGLQLDTSVADAWGAVDGSGGISMQPPIGSGVHPDAAYADAWGSPSAQQAGSGGAAPAASEQTHFSPGDSAAADDADEDDPFGWMMDGGGTESPSAPVPAPAPAPAPSSSSTGGARGRAAAAYNPAGYRPQAAAPSTGGGAGGGTGGEAIEERWLCRLCKARKSAFVCKPCLHFGPCSSCVPVGESLCFWPCRQSLHRQSLLPCGCRLLQSDSRINSLSCQRTQQQCANADELYP